MTLLQEIELLEESLQEFLQMKRTLIVEDSIYNLLVTIAELKKELYFKDDK